MRPRLQKKTEVVEDEKPSGLQIQRGLVKLRKLPVPNVASTLIPNGVVLITDDERGVADACADRLANFGQEVVVVKHTEMDTYSTGGFAADLTKPKQVTALIADVDKQLGSIAGVIHLLPLSKIDESQNPATRAEVEIKSIYLIAKTIEEQICGIAKSGNAFVLSSTALGGQLGFGKNKLDSIARAGSGSISGFLKCIGMEWPDVLVRSIDFYPTVAPAEVVESIERELSDSAGPFEVGYLKGQRVTWEPVDANFPSKKT